MDRTIVWMTGGAIVAALLGGGTAIATGNAAGDDDTISDPALGRATRAALEHTNGGTVIETDSGEDGAAYGVEIRLDDGREVEVALDRGFNVIGGEAEAEATGDQEPGDLEGPGDDEDSDRD